MHEYIELMELIFHSIRQPNLANLERALVFETVKSNIYILTFFQVLFSYLINIIITSK